MISNRLERPFHRVHVTKRALGTTRKSVVGLMRCRCTALRGHIPSEPLLFQLLGGGPHVAAIGMTRSFLSFV